VAWKWKSRGRRPRRRQGNGVGRSKSESTAVGVGRAPAAGCGIVDADHFVPIRSAPEDLNLVASILTFGSWTVSFFSKKN
jgi:hypothetical protein